MEKIKNKNYKVLTPFKGWALQNFPFIEADFDALTNYELMCKITEYLNTVIYNQREVQNLSTELLEYINSYFDNLDVQEEINNKLDEMVEDGTLEELIKNYIDTNVIIAFPHYNSNSIESVGDDTQGDCSIIKTKNKVMLIDTMKTNDNYLSIKNTLNNLNITKIDYILITHYHYDHYATLDNFFNDFDLSECTFLIPRLPTNPNVLTEAQYGYDYIMNILNSHNVTPITCNNQSFILDDATIKLMNSSENDYNYIDASETYDYNNYSVCCELLYKDRSAFFTGDIADIGQTNVKQYMQGNYDIMKDAHHGLSSYNVDFARLTNPKELVVPVTKAMWNYNQARLGGSLLAYYMSQTNNIYLLGYQENSIIYALNSAGVKLLSKNSVYNNLKLPIRGTITYYVNAGNNNYIRDGSELYPFTSLKECISLINKNANINYVINVLSDDNTSSRYTVFGLKNTIINFNNHITGSITLEKCVNVTIKNINMRNQLENDSYGDLYIINSKNITLDETNNFITQSKNGIEVLNTYNFILLDNINISNKNGAFIFGNSKVILNPTNINLTNVTVSCIWCYNSEIEGTESAGTLFRNAFPVTMPIITGSNQKKCIISDGFKKSINTIYSGDISTGSIEFSYPILEFDKIEVFYNNGSTDLGVTEIPIANIARSHDIILCYPSENLDKLYYTNAQLYGGPAGTYLSITRNTNITLPDGTVGTSKIHITKLILK